MQYTLHQINASHVPVRIENLWVSPHFGVMMNRVNGHSNKSSLPELNTTQHTVLNAVTSGSALRSYTVHVLAHVHKLVGYGPKDAPCNAKYIQPKQ